MVVFFLVNWWGGGCAGGGATCRISCTIFCFENKFCRSSYSACRLQPGVCTECRQDGVTGRGHWCQWAGSGSKSPAVQVHSPQSPSAERPGATAPCRGTPQRPPPRYDSEQEKRRRRRRGNDNDNRKYTGRLVFLGVLPHMYHAAVLLEGVAPRFGSSCTGQSLFTWTSETRTQRQETQRDRNINDLRRSSSSQDKRPRAVVSNIRLGENTGLL